MADDVLGKFCELKISWPIFPNGHFLDELRMGMNVHYSVIFLLLHAKRLVVGAMTTNDLREIRMRFFPVIRRLHCITLFELII